jgi:hypothetical protein
MSDLEGIEEIAEQTSLREFGGSPSMLQGATKSDIDELEQIALQADIRVNTRSKHGSLGWRGAMFGWSGAPNLERAKAAHAPVEVAPKESVEPEEPAPIIHVFAAADVTCYTELIVGIQQRIGELGIRQVDFDKLAGFAEGLTGKAFGPSQVKRLGPEKLFDAIRAAGLRLRLEADPEQLEKMRGQIAEHCQPRQGNQARMGNHAHPSQKVIDSVVSHLVSRDGGLAILNKAVIEANLQLAAKKRKRNVARFRSQPLRSPPIPLVGFGKRRGSKYG